MVTSNQKHVTDTQKIKCNKLNRTSRENHHHAKEDRKETKKKEDQWVQWLTPTIPALWEARGNWITRSGDQDHPAQHGEIRSLLKVQKLAGCGGVCL